MFVGRDFRRGRGGLFGFCYIEAALMVMVESTKGGMLMWMFGMTCRKTKVSVRKVLEAASQMTQSSKSAMRRGLGGRFDLFVAVTSLLHMSMEDSLMADFICMMFFMIWRLNFTYGWLHRRSSDLWFGWRWRGVGGVSSSGPEYIAVVHRWLEGDGRGCAFDKKL